MLVDVVTWLRGFFYDKDTVDGKLSNKVDDTDSRLSDNRNPLNTNIPNTTTAKDLNNFTSMGFYSCNSNEYAQYISHCPISNKSFHLLVESFNSGQYVKQTWTQRDEYRTFIRVRNANSTWSSWAEIFPYNAIQTSFSSSLSDRKVASEKLVKDSLDLKQATLVSGVNIATINSQSLLTGGDIEIGGGSGGGIISVGTDWTDADDSYIYINAISGVSYHLEFAESSYTAIGGTVTVSCTLLENYEPKENATISFSGGTSTVTATTDSNGVATATVTFASDGTLTATYEDATDTCSITYSAYIFYDDVTSDRSNEYYNESLQSSSRTGYLALTYNSNGYYTIQANNNEGNHYAKWIDILDGEDNIKFSCEVATNTNNGGNRYGIVVGTDNYKNERYQITNGKLEHQTFRGTTETLLDTQNLGLSANTFYKLEFIVQGTSYTFTISDMSDNVLYTTTSTFQSNVITSSDEKKFGLYYLNYYSSGIKMYRNIKAEPL